MYTRPTPDPDNCKVPIFPFSVTTRWTWKTGCVHFTVPDNTYVVDRRNSIPVHTQDHWSSHYIIPTYVGVTQHHIAARDIRGDGHLNHERLMHEGDSRSKKAQLAEDSLCSFTAPSFEELLRSEQMVSPVFRNRCFRNRCSHPSSALQTTRPAFADAMPSQTPARYGYESSPGGINARNVHPGNPQEQGGQERADLQEHEAYTWDLLPPRPDAILLPIRTTKRRACNRDHVYPLRRIKMASKYLSHAQVVGALFLWSPTRH